MSTYVVLLRGINVGGSGKLAMQDLASLCENCGYKSVRTYIQSGNVVLASGQSEVRIKQTLETALAEKMGKAVDVKVRTGEEIASVLERNPFQKSPPNKVLVLFLDKAPPMKVLAGVVAPGGEEVQIDGREVFIHYPNGIGRSKLKLPLTEAGTGRNINTVGKLAKFASEIE